VGGGVREPARCAAVNKTPRAGHPSWEYQHVTLHRLSSKSPDDTFACIGKLMTFWKSCTIMIILY
jgi:hypothetical protein